jgi:AraC family transcriptional regulator
MTTAAARTGGRLHRVLRYIDEHLEDELGLATLSGVAAVSKFHFHRQFTALAGVGVHRYVQLRRLKRASHRLAFRSADTIITIALDSGYDGPEAFARAFKRSTGQTPSEFRQRPDWAMWHDAYRPIREVRRRHLAMSRTTNAVEIVEFRDTRVAALEHRGDPALIEDSVRRFIAFRRRADLPPTRSATFNVWYDDPDATPAEEFRLDLCAATDCDIGANDAGIVMKTIPAGRCAVLRHVGSDDSIADAVIYLYAEWLPNSGEELRDYPLYFQRIRFFPDVPEHEAVTDIFLPLR